MEILLLFLLKFFFMGDRQVQVDSVGSSREYNVFIQNLNLQSLSPSPGQAVNVKVAFTFKCGSTVERVVEIVFPNRGLTEKSVVTNFGSGKEGMKRFVLKHNQQDPYVLGVTINYGESFETQGFTQEFASFTSTIEDASVFSQNLDQISFVIHKCSNDLRDREDEDSNACPIQNFLNLPIADSPTSYYYFKIDGATDEQSFTSALTLFGFKLASFNDIYNVQIFKRGFVIPNFIGAHEPFRLTGSASALNQENCKNTVCEGLLASTGNAKLKLKNLGAENNQVVTSGKTEHKMNFFLYQKDEAVDQDKLYHVYICARMTMDSEFCDVGSKSMTVMANHKMLKTIKFSAHLPNKYDDFIVDILVHKFDTLITVIPTLFQVKIPFVVTREQLPLTSCVNKLCFHIGFSPEKNSLKAAALVQYLEQEPIDVPSDHVKLCVFNEDTGCSEDLVPGEKDLNIGFEKATKYVTLLAIVGNKYITPLDIKLEENSYATLTLSKGDDFSFTVEFRLHNICKRDVPVAELLVIEGGARKNCQSTASALMGDEDELPGLIQSDSAEETDKKDQEDSKTRENSDSDKSESSSKDTLKIANYVIAALSGVMFIIICGMLVKTYLLNKQQSSA